MSSRLESQELAAISVVVYDRFSLFKKCIKSLAKNKLAKHSVLCIFSDYPKKNDEEKVIKIREYAKSIKGFKKVELFFNNKNNYKKNVKKSLSIPFKFSSKLIILEDDVEVGKHFLEYMNEGLRKYEFHQKVYMVSGYVNPVKYKIKDDFFFQRRPGPWGIGYTHRKYKIIKKNISSKKLVSFFINNWNAYKKLCDISPHIIVSLPSLYRKELQAEDYLICMFQIKHNKFTLFPKKSLTKNLGYDGSGMRSGINKTYTNQKVFNGRINLKTDIMVQSNIEIEKKIGDFYKKKQKYKKFIAFILINIMCKSKLFDSFIKLLINFKNKIY